MDNINNKIEDIENSITISKEFYIIFREFLRNVCSSLLNIEGDRLVDLDNTLGSEEATNTIAKFANSSDVYVLFMEGSTNGVTLSVDPRNLLNRTNPCIAIVKSRETLLDASKPIAFQVQITTIATGGENENNGGWLSLLMLLQQFARHVYAPLIRTTSQNIHDSHGTTDENENVVMLQKRIREFDVALEQCQRGTTIPQVMIAVPDSITNASKTCNAATLKTYLERYNASQADQLFTELQLNNLMGTTQEKKEEFANEINKFAKLWPGEISKQTRLIESSFPGSAEAEIEFWKELDKKLADSKDQLESCPVLLTKLILKRTNRVSEQLIREEELKLEKAIETVQVSLSFLRDIPLEELISSSDLHPKLSRTVSACLQHFSKLKHSRYDFSRAVRLLEVLGALVSSRIVSLLKEKNIMQCTFDDFRRVKRQSDEVFKAWDTHFATQRTMLKDVAKRRNESSEKLKNLSFDIEPLRQRLNYISEFREQHDKLLNVFSAVLFGQEGTFLIEINEAYQLVIRSCGDVLDISPSSLSSWIAARQSYEKRLEKIEEHIINVLEERLSTAKTADEMFRVFSIFNPLFFRPNIRAAVNSFRTNLVKNVREDVKRLQEKFRLRYDESLERATADLRDIPPLSGRIIWARQIENQLSTLMKRMEDILGQGWEDHPEGKQLKEVCDELKGYLETDQLYNDWLTQQLKADTQKYNKLKDFLVIVEEDTRTGSKNVRVNFDEKQVIIFKEVRYLEWLLPSMSTAHKTIPSTIRSQSKEAFNRYPIAMAIEAALSGFSQAKQVINESNMQLLAAHIQSVREIIKEALGGSKRSKRWIKWDSNDISDWVGQLSNKVFSLQERVDDVNEKIKTIGELIQSLKSCKYERKAFEEIMDAIQKIVDEMQIRGFSNMHLWLNELDKKIEGILSDRLKAAILVWVRAFKAESSNNHYDNYEKDANTLRLDQTVHEILLANQILYLSPPLEQARFEWIQAFHQYLAVAGTLPRIIKSRFQVFAEVDDSIKDFSNVIYTIDSDTLSHAFIAIEQKLALANNHVQQWLQYQALWDASFLVIAERLGRNVSKWRQLLNEIKAARSTIDSVDDETCFGPIVINHRQVQHKVNMKYDTWQKESQLRFGAILLEEIKSTHTDILSSKTRLETTYLEGATKDVIAAVEFILKTKKSIEERKSIVSELDLSEKLLQKQRYQFPQDWLSVSNVTSAMNDLTQIFDRRSAAMDTQIPALQSKIREEDLSVVSKTEELLQLWKTNKPVEGDRVPSAVLHELSMISSQVTKLQEDFDRIKGAKEALGLDFVSDDRLSYVAQEVNDLREAWQSVSPIQEKLNALRSLPFKDVNSLKIRKQLEEYLDELKTLPAKVRSYAAVEVMQDKINKLMSFQPILRDVGTEALKDRHWKVLLTKLSIHQSHANLTLGIFWDSNALSQRKVISEVLMTAQGELALEEFLRGLREFWVGCELSLVQRDGVRLITGWDVLFSTLEDNLNSLAFLKQSPYFKNVPEFQEDTLNWESKLTNFRGIFDIWIEVQRKWVYLRGIFKNPDIKAQLPTQYTKFKSVDNEFTSLMKRVALKPAVMDLLQIDNLARQLERQDNSMTMIQKALGEYLEKQRQLFPRFYFVNNDDLVEIIGNSNEPAKIIPHLGNMFAAITTIELNVPTTSEEGLLAIATSISSKEGEMVKLYENVKVTALVKEWLIQLESQMYHTVASLLKDAVSAFPKDNAEFLDWISKFPAQVVILSSQTSWTQKIEDALSVSAKSGEKISDALQVLEGQLKALSTNVLQDLPSELRKKSEQLLTEMVHQRDVTRLIVSNDVNSKTDFKWLYHLRFYWNPKESNLMKQLCIRMAQASFFYGFEYLGIGDRLVQTPLTDRCYLTLTQALHFRLGGNPFGPAGTGKTESVKMLGSQLGRFVLVFNCDSSFDYAAMGRIFAGLCQVGAWGCFDEFNRLEERILSAVSQQILTIQRGLMMHQKQIELLGNSCRLREEVGIFVTLNPGYAGRSNLPDNLKQLFRAVAMTIPDRNLIAQVMLFSQGIVTAEELAGKITLLFTLCEEQLSSQSHYDFGLRALKSVLVGAGELKRVAISSNSNESLSDDAMAQIEINVLIKSTCGTILPKLVAEDIPLFSSLLIAVFPGIALPKVNDDLLIDAIKTICEEDSLEFDDTWIQKILQLKQVLDMRHGVMMVGPSGTGKSTAWRVLLKALSKVDGVKGDFHIIDPKSIKKEKLYGSLDPNTLDWTDGVFTKLLRKVAETSTTRGGTRRCWIVFDGDVDPEWAENLNSVLDDNKVLTLPSGDRIKIPVNVRIMMEVDTLKYATLATVSRCGMIWFAHDTLSIEILLRQQLKLLLKEDVHLLEASSYVNTSKSTLQSETQEKFVAALTPYFTSKPCLVSIALDFAMSQPHIMEVSVGRLLTTLNCLLVRGIATAIDYNESNSDFPMSDSQIESFSSKWLLYSLVWAFGGSMAWDKRAALSEVVISHSTATISNGKSLFDVHIGVGEGNWLDWAASVPRIEIESHKVTSTDVVIATVDTLRHTEVIRAWIASHKALILCGPPGSGKTMTLSSVLEAMPDLIFAALNFSSGTTPELILTTFAQYCEVVDSPDGLIMQPNRQTYRESQWLVVFCDEINLPDIDAYGTQRVIMFIRQLIEHNGFWNSDCKWVQIRRIQFVGACNPPTDSGRKSLSERFMRHAPLLFVDYPAEVSLKQIYRCFNHGLLKLHPNLRGATDSLNNAMVDFYMRNQEKFTPDVAPQYIYSPRELSRWVRAMYEAMEPAEAMTMEELVRLWGHEALRLFQDRLINDDEKAWCLSQLHEVGSIHFAVDINECLKQPMLYSNWLRKTYQSTDKDELRDFVAARLKVFYEEELDVPLVIFDDVLDHVLRIDNVLRHPMGHLLLVGESGVGKTVLSRFVSWMNGLQVFQIKANNRYTLEQFDDDLRGLFRRVGIDGEKICFIFDESNALSSSFLEKMNALLASGEIPGLFEGDDRSQLMSSLRESISQKDEVMMDSGDELWRRFVKTIQRNLHVIFTMNPASADFSNRCTASPALFNRCVVDWFGTWSPSALVQVVSEFTKHLDTGYTTYEPQGGSEMLALVMDTLNCENVGLHEAVVAAVVSFHDSAKKIALKVAKVSGRQHYLSPRDFLDVIRKFVVTEQEKRSSLEEQQTHIRTGLQKLLETQEEVGKLRQEMVEKEAILRAKDEEANQKLAQMVEKQNEAEQRKAMAEQLTGELTTQNEEIRVRKEAVEKELSEAEPSLLSAKESVRNIRKAQLDEIRVLTRPPRLVQLTLEMVSIMIGEKDLDWIEIRKVIKREDFVSTIVNFDPLTLTTKQVHQVQETYLNLTDLSYEKVDNASKACGPLYQWAESQIKYATILRKVKPLRDEVVQLQEKSETLEILQKETVAQAAELEAAIKQYKLDYASAIRDTEMIRTEMDGVTKKVQRAEALLQSLEQENDRWQSTSASFDKQMSTLIGDSLLAAAFLTYAGIFDHKIRKRLWIEWCDTIEVLGIPFKKELDVVSYLSTLSDQMLWRGYGLPSDELAIQNGILLERFHRFPLIIDPSGQATAFLINKYSSQKITQASFLDASFLKTLASAIRFGTPLLVNDVESLDPILNPVLNKEFQKTGGRTLIRLGTEEIDYSPKFMIILATRNPLAHFPPDLCSRVTLVNFTVTPASLESQALSAILKSQRPDVDSRRTEILRVQSEQTAKLRELEDALLNKISAVQGAILNDDTVIKTLEKIKAEATDLNREVMNTEEVMNEVKAISNIYEPLANAMASVYFTLEQLADVSFLYQFSLQYFVVIIDTVLNNGSDSNKKTPPDDKTAKAQLRELQNKFYREVARRALRSLKFDDKLMFIVRLAQIATNGQPEKMLTSQESDILFRGSSNLETSSATLQKYKDSIKGRSLEDRSARQLISLTSLPAFSKLLDSMMNHNNEWNTFMDHPEPENVMPTSWQNATQDLERVTLLKAMVINALRPERILYALDMYITSVFGDDFKWREYCKLDLQYIIEKDSKALSPILICSEAGQDLSGKVDSLAISMDKSLLQVAMGSAEGYTEADKSIALASKNGSWVLLRNVHLCSEWLGLLEKRIHGLSAHSNFRLFLTCEISPKLPSALLRLSEVVVAEASTGIKANIQRFFNSIPSARVDKAPAERCRLYGLIAWFNAVVQERLRYVPLGWTKRYEFNETDGACALDVIDEWINEIAGGRAHMNPEDLPWQAIKTLVSESLYGGRIDHPFDQAALDSFIESTFSPKNYASSSALVIDPSGAAIIKLPDGLNRQAFEKWMQELPDANSPAWLGLPVTAESQLQTNLGQRTLRKLTLLQGILDETSTANDSGDSRPQLKGLLDATEKWLKALPADSSLLKLDAKSTSDVDSTPLHRCLAREVDKGHSILIKVRADLNLVSQYCTGTVKATNYIRDLVNCIVIGVIPPQWRSYYTVVSHMSLGTWVVDFIERTKILNGYGIVLSSPQSKIPKFSYHIGYMFSPETFITATRQYTSHIKKWSLEELELFLEIEKTDIESEQDTIIEEFVLEGAKWTNGGIKLSDELRCKLPPSRLTWRRKSQRPSGNYTQFPVYLNEARSSLVAVVLVETPNDIAAYQWATRSVSFVMQPTF